MREVSELYEKKIKCPVCKEQFKTNKVRTSTLKLVKRDADFLSYYQGENPLFYNVFVCPNCGYAALENKFSKIRPREVDTIKNTISPKWNKRDFLGKRTVDDAIEAYKLALLSGQILEYNKYDLANICIRLSWLNRMKDDKDEEERFTSLARDLYKEAYTNESVNMGVTTLAYLIGELSRKVGEKEEAINWFNTALRSPDIKENVALEKMVREQWQAVKEG
ncbi:DUF2225 domain-containing protein [Anaerosalibacter sp. Marseille-P3206]|uniref:DUF2225 domain-containing protein n=1 Tax=Anaerosalibacter sp. Marseille-P3206 TaxID=1871005 RepID=UPI000985508D|nr:DUF2225 domain-containing protein [Anaerosalibacter sp. Marseille-P3206]